MIRTITMRCLILIIVSLLAVQAHADPAGELFFEAKIRPLLVDQCFSCHSAQAKKLKGGLHLDSREGALKGGETGPALEPGAPDKSRMIEAVGYKNVDLQMPPKDKLSDQQIADLTAWVKMGAPWGKESVATTAPIAKLDAFDLQKRKAAHWAWQPVQPQTPPSVKDTAWSHGPIDRFILAKLEEQNIHPAAPADRRTLLRRIYFDLIGLPPKPQEVDDFVNDPAPNATEKVVDRLLASPRFGERWGRHWLDLIRFSETMGHEFDFPIPNAWRYRDYVIRAFNDDVPYNQFVSEHVAGDLLDKPRRRDNGDNESILATGFWFFGEDVQAPVDVRQHQADLMDNRIDVFGKTFAGLTIACARCHDHKFDAIATADYYALYGYTKGARYTQAVLNDTAIAAHAQRLKLLKDKLRTAVAQAMLAHGDAIAPDAASVQIFPTRDGDIELLADHFADWRPDGPAFTSATIGDFTPGTEARPIAKLVTTSAYTSASLSTQLQGYLRSPSFPISKRYLHLRAAGQGARVNLVIDNFVVIRDPIYGGLKRTLKHDQPTWLTFDLAMWQGRQAYIEIADTTVADPGGPGSPADAWATLTHAMLSEQARPPVSLAQKSSSADLRSTIEFWRDGQLATAPDAAARVACLAAALDKASAELASDDAIKTLLNEYHALDKSLPAPTFALAAADADAGDEAIFIRGNPKTLGPAAPRRYLEAIGTQDSALRTSSSRLALAGAIASPENPLTARVMVNRVWHHLFGRGIVGSVDNFGVMGEKPSHPELLDYLAADFTRNNWSIKHLIRSIVLSSTYQQASSQEPELGTQDVSNQLFHRQNVRRLEGEAIRDDLLAVSGRLDLTTGGPGVPVHLTPFMEGRGRPGSSGPLDGAGRRSIYLEVRRNFLPPMLLAFDTPTPFNTMGRRSVSNVPAQALILMNDPFVQQQAKLWAGATLADKGAAPAQRVLRMYMSAFSRPPTAGETSAVLAFLDQQAAQLDIAEAERLNDVRPWTDLAHALINTKEFIFIN
jgi:cytochrome c553